MSTVKIYGVAFSRSIANIWAALELGIPYERVPIGWHDNSIYSEAYRAINPNRRVPCLQDGDFILWETMAINLYLAKKQGGAMAPKGLREDALMTQWSFWSALQLERPLGQFAYNTYINDPPDRNAEVAGKAWSELQPLFAVLDAQLARTIYLVGDRFTIADLNVAAMFFRPRRGGPIDLGPYPNLKRWEAAVFARPMAEKAWQVRQVDADRY